MKNKITYVVEDSPYIGYVLYITTQVNKEFWIKYDDTESYLLHDGSIVVTGDSNFISSFYVKRFGLFIGRKYVNTKIHDDINISNYTIKGRLDSQTIYFSKLEDLDVFVENIKHIFKQLIIR